MTPAELRARWRRLWRASPELVVIAVFLLALFIAELAAWLVMR